MTKAQHFEETRLIISIAFWRAKIKLLIYCLQLGFEQRITSLVCVHLTKGSNQLYWQNSKTKFVLKHFEIQKMDTDDVDKPVRI